ncbi:immune inhibitor A domain-containing protein [Nocardioides hankookensis]|uniref:Immune inhibitor A domain-containing protein n=1 Tax=Nocardioides hankookensis TaxID=443157 RepID=A0ABW1LR03_9ACTN
MNRRAIASVSALAAASLLPFVAAAPAPAEPTGRAATQVAPDHAREDNRLHPLAQRDNARRQQAVDALATGDARLAGRGSNRRIRLADGTDISYPATQQAQLLTFLVEFGDASPQHNQIPAPPVEDNANYWRADFNRQHYLDMFFNGLPEQDGESFKDVYDEMSSGRFDVEGDVSDWVRVDRPESYYGANVDQGQESADRLAEYVDDTVDAWYDALPAGTTDQQAKDYLAQFDVWDRYDADHDGNYNEPDGYIDHFQAIHAGAGEEAGAGPDAIWSQRFGASWWTDSGPTPSAGCSACTHQGGVEIGDTGYYVLDFTTEPENGGLGVFAHEFGHDLGLPDYYDTASADPDNGTGFWNLMSSGSWMSQQGAPTGTTPNHMGATEKLFLGWYGDQLATVDGQADTPQRVVLGPSNHATSTGAQAVLVQLPDGHQVDPGPMSGSEDDAYLYSGTGDRYFAASSSPPIHVSPGASELSARVAYQIEPGFDYAYLRVSDDDGATWTDVPTSASVDPDSPDPANFGITGVSGAVLDPDADFRAATPSWVDLTADLSAFEGETVRMRWEYLTDGRTHGFGIAVDDVALGDHTTTYGASHPWTAEGFHTVLDDEFEVTFPQYYLAENRQYRGYDTTLKSGPYSANDQADPNRVDHFAYQDGLLVWYADGYFSDNDTSAHPGGGANLPVDARPTNQVWRTPAGAVGPLAAGRLQTFDATFDVDRTTGIDMTASSGLRLRVPAASSVPVFDDSDRTAYLDDSGGPAGLQVGTRVGGTGTMVQVVSSDESTGRMVLLVGKRFVAATAPPRVPAKVRVGATVRATPPAWFQDGVTRSVRWLRDGKVIRGAQGLAYLIRPADLGHRLSVSVTGARSGYRSTTTTSAATGRVLRGDVRIDVGAGTARPGRPVRVRVGVVAGHLAAPGRIQVSYDGRSLGRVTLKRGAARLRLPARARGRHVLVVRYLGAPGFAAAKRTVRVSVR